jgi:hypothetical protein
MKKVLQLIGKKTFVFSAFLMFGNVFGQVSLPHYDGFAGSVGNLGDLPGWVNFNGTAGDFIQVGSGTLSYTGLPVSTGNKVVFSGAGIDAAKAFTQQAVGFGTIYVSFLLNITDVTGLSTTNGGYFCGINDTTNGFASTIWLRSDSNGGYNIGLAPRTTTSTIQWGVSRALNTTYLVVLSLTSINGGTNNANGNDVSKIWVNPILGITEPTPTSQITSTTGDLQSINRVFIRQAASASETPFIEMDELRIGLSWESVTGGIVWNGTAWSNGTGPTVMSNASIDGVYDTSVNGVFTAQNLNVGAGPLTIKSGTNITLSGSATNNLTADKFVVESNANLIQTNVATNTGNITVNRNVDLQRLDYVYWASPVTGTQTLAGFSPLTLPNRFYTFNEVSNNFVAASSTSTFAQGRGYAIRAPDTFAASSTTQFVGAFQGVPNNGNFNVNVTATANTNVGYNLIGNPYPSTVSGVAFLTANSGSLNFWTHTSRTAGLNNYAIYTLAGGTAAVAGGSAPNGFIQVGQGFMFIPSQPAPYSGIVTFTNAMRDANNANQFFRTSNQIENNGSQNRFWLNLTGNDEAFSQILVGYFDNASSGFDGSFDAKQTNTGNTLLYSLIGNEPMAIQAKGNFEVVDKVYLGFKATVAGNYTLKINHLEGNFALNQSIYIKDNLTGIVHDIKANPYNFVSVAGTFNNRFEVVYESTLSNTNNIFDTNSVVVFNNNDVLNINASTNLKAVKVFDVRGREIFEKLNINADSTSLSLSPQHQVLLVQITNNDGLVVTKKVIF